jgi:inner membrane protein
MDPISQAVLGASFAQAAAKNKEQIVAAAWFGALAGMAPDLDFVIASPSDPLLFLEFHRQFTHSLIFIPLGALLVAWPLFKLQVRFFRQYLSLRESYLFCLLGYATHGLLDACTSYGTQLLWPFTDERFAWNNISIIDPLFTLPLLILVALAAYKRRRGFAIAACLWALSYLSMGWLQVDRAVAAGELVAAQRGHIPERITVKPSFANLFLWKVIYEFEGHYYVDAVRVLNDQQWCEGESIAKFDVDNQFPTLAPDSQQRIDIERFRWFSGDYLAVNALGQVIDMRYSFLPNEVAAMWGIEITPSKPDTHVTWWANRDLQKSQREDLYLLLSGESCKPL